MFRGVNYVGIGVSNMERSLKFYGDLIGFKEIVFDYTGSLPGMEKVTGKLETRARVVMLKNQNEGPLGRGMIKLVYLLPPDKSEPCTVVDSTPFGDIGIAEVAVSVRGGVQAAFDELLQKGVKPILPPKHYSFPPDSLEDTGASIREPDNGFFEFVEWDNCRPFGKGLRIHGVNHVGFGISNWDNSWTFYQNLGFTESLFEFNGDLVLPKLFPRAQELRLAMWANYHGAWLEPIQLLSPLKPTPFTKAWGHLGPMEFAIEVSNLEKAYEDLQKKGIKFLCPPQTIEVSSGQWRYAYLVEPDNLYVSLVEPRY